MAIKIIGAGLGRTGTMSLKAALEELGFGKCYHMIELLKNPEQIDYWEAAGRDEAIAWDELFTGYQATVDYPACRYWRELMQYYPEAKVLLSVRDPDSWYESANSTIYRVEPGLFEKLKLLVKLPFSPRLRHMVRIFRMVRCVIWQGDFEGRFEDKQFALERFQQHIEEVKRTVPAERLLVFHVKEGWEPLCRFLEVPVPAKPFPRLNDRSDFLQMRDEFLSSLQWKGTRH